MLRSDSQPKLLSLRVLKSSDIIACSIIGIFDATQTLPHIPRSFTHRLSLYHDAQTAEHPIG
jgi:hypothetical protein